MILKGDFKGFRKLFLPLVAMIGGMFLITIILGTIIHLLTKLDYLSVLFGCIPGGLSDTTIIAEQLGADISISASLQIVRCVIVLALFPAFVALLTKNEEPYYEISNRTDDVHLHGVHSNILQMIITLIAGLLGGIIGNYFPIVPAAPLYLLRHSFSQ